MRSTIQKSHKIQFALAVCAALILFDTPAEATTVLTLGSDMFQSYRGINIPPYLASVTTTTGTYSETTNGLLVFCLSEKLISNWGGAYFETVHLAANSQETAAQAAAEAEAAFLAAYSLYLHAPKSNAQDQTFVDNVEGPISMAIWEIMGTLGDTVSRDPKAEPYIQLAKSAYSDRLITADFLASVNVYMPIDNPGIQPFMTAVRNDAVILSVIPEPGTWILLVSGVGLMALGRRRSRV